VATNNLTEGDKFALLQVLAEDVGVLGVFSDWPATTTFFANCMDVGMRDDGKIEDVSESASMQSRLLYIESFVLLAAFRFIF